MITKAKKQKAKSEKAKKQKGGKRKSEKPKKKGRLESRDANPHSKTEKITIGGRRTPVVSK